MLLHLFALIVNFFQCPCRSYWQNWQVCYLLQPCDDILEKLMNMRKTTVSAPSSRGLLGRMLSVSPTHGVATLLLTTSTTACLLRLYTTAQKGSARQNTSPVLYMHGIRQVNIEWQGRRGRSGAGCNISKVTLGLLMYIMLCLSCRSNTMFPRK